MKRTSTDEVLHLARQVAFLGAHVPDREDGWELLGRSLDRLYKAVTVLDSDEPDFTYCCGCRELIDLEAGQEQWVLDGAKYHEACYQTQTKNPTP